MATTVQPRLPDASLTVAAALRLPSIRRGAPRVVAGHASLGRKIRWAHSAEVRNIATLLKGNELLLTTGMGIGHRAHDQRRFVRALVDRQVAGVVVELGQVFAQLPGPLVQAADEHQLPLVELHREVPFVDITEEIHSSILSRQLAALRRGEELHRLLTEQMLEGAGIQEILAALAAMIANPVLLEKTSQGVISHATHRTPAAEVLSAWRLLGAVEAAGTETIVDAGRAKAIIVPVLTAGRSTWGRLIALGLDSPLDDFDRVAVERAVTLVSLELLRTRQEMLLVSREQGGFLGDVAAGRLSANDAAAAAEVLGFRHRRELLLPLAVTSSDNGGVRAVIDETQWALVWRATRDELTSRGISALIGIRAAEHDTLLLLCAPGPSRRIELARLCADIVRTAIREHLGSADLAVVAVGPAVATWEELPGALRAAARTAALSKARPDVPLHDATVADVDRLLRSLSDHSEVLEFAERQLGPILDHDRRRAAKLMPTLEALCANRWSRISTARALHLNRQSLYPQLRRLERLLGVDLDDPKTRLGIELAVRVYRQGRLGSRSGGDELPS